MKMNSDHHDNHIVTWYDRKGLIMFLHTKYISCIPFINNVNSFLFLLQNVYLLDLFQHNKDTRNERRNNEFRRCKYR